MRNVRIMLLDLLATVVTSKLRRFEVTTAEDRDIVIRHFSNLKTKDEQDALLASLVSVHPEEVGRRIDNKLSSINVHLNIM